MKKHSKTTPSQVTPEVMPLLADLRRLIDDARRSAAVAVNAELTLMYWRIGKRIHDDVLQGERAGYGNQIVATLSRQLSLEYGRSFSEKNLRHMMRFAESFPSEEIVSTLSRQLASVIIEIQLSPHCVDNLTFMIMQGKYS